MRSNKAIGRAPVFVPLIAVNPPLLPKTTSSIFYCSAKATSAPTRQPLNLIAPPGTTILSPCGPIVSSWLLFGYALYSLLPPDRQNTAGDGYFGITLNADNDELDLNTSDNNFRQALYDVLAFVKTNAQLNTRTYPNELLIGQSGDQEEFAGVVESPRSGDTYQNLMRNCVVSIAVKNPAGNTLSGFYGQVDAPSGHSLGDPMKVAVAFGKGYQHEFSHAFGLMLDEYIHDRGSFATGKQNPSHQSVFEMWNLSYTGHSHMVPWLHLSPAGLHPRAATARVGQMWKGGRRKEKGVWHSEYHCQMNGGHENYFSRTDEADPVRWVW